MNGEGLYMITKITSGNVVERRKWKVQRRASRGSRVRGNSTEKKQLGNREAAVLQMTRIMNCNMRGGDLLLTLTINEHGAEVTGNTYEGIKREARKCIDRILYRLKKSGIMAKWFLIPSVMDGDTGEVVRAHAHIVITAAGFSMKDGVLMVGEESVENIWGLGEIDYKSLHNQEDFYPLCKYLISQARGVADEKKYSCSRNMEKPKIERIYVSTSAPLRVPAGAHELEGTRYDAEKGINMVRYIKPSRKTADKQVGGHKELTLSMEYEDGGGDDEL